MMGNIEYGQKRLKEIVEKEARGKKTKTVEQEEEQMPTSISKMTSIVMLIEINSTSRR